MAIVMIGLSECPICGAIIDESRPYVATSGIAFPPGHRLFQYCDAPLHLDCLVSWPDRGQLARRYYDRDVAYHQSFGGVLIEAEDWILLCGPAAAGEKPDYVCLRQCDWPMTLVKVRWAQWEALLAGEGAEAWRSPPIAGALAPIMQRLAKQLPDQGALDRLHEQQRLTGR